MQVVEGILTLLMLFFIVSVFTCLGIFLIDRLTDTYVNRNNGKEDD